MPRRDSRVPYFSFTFKKEDIGKGYQSLADNLAKFDELGKLPRTLQLDRINEGQGIEAAMVTNEAKWQRPVDSVTTTKCYKGPRRKSRMGWCSTQV